MSNTLTTIAKAAKELGIPYRQLLQGVNEGIIPHYRIQKSRRLIKLSDVLAIMEQPSVNGGSHE